METMTSIHRPEIRLHAKALCDAASSMGSVQIRNRASGWKSCKRFPQQPTPRALRPECFGGNFFSFRHKRTSIEEVLGTCPNKIRCQTAISSWNFNPGKKVMSLHSKIGSRSEVSIAGINLAVSAKYEDAF